MNSAAPKIDRNRGSNYKSKQLGLPKKWSHQRELESLKGKLIEIQFAHNRDTWQRFLLVEADQFALQIRAAGEQSTLTYNKSSIIGYRAV